MIVIQCWVEGTMSILLNRATEEALSGRTRSNNPGEQEDPRTIGYQVDSSQSQVGHSRA
jgi:hypothetical protein